MEKFEGYKLLEGEFGEQINLADFTDKNIIRSYGGDLETGFAAYDMLKRSNGSEVGIVGVGASSATVALLGASVRWGTENSKFAIHNPYAKPTGDAEKLRETANRLEEEQNKLVVLYKNELLIDEVEIKQIMQKGELFGSAEALRIGLIQFIKVDDMGTIKGHTAKEVFFNLKESEMNKEDLNKELETGFEKFFNKMKDIFQVKVKNLLVKAVSGEELDIDVETIEQIEEGVAVMLDGSPATGEFVFEDGTTIKVEAGKITKVIPPAEDELAIANAKIEELQGKLDESEKAKNESEEAIQNQMKVYKSAKKELDEFKNIFSEKINNLAIPEDKIEKKVEKVRKPFKKKE